MNKDDQVTVLGVKLSVISNKDLLGFIDFRLKKKNKFIISTPNPEIILLAQRNLELMRALNEADVALPDGIGVVMANLILNRKKAIHRIPGRQAMLDLFSYANDKRLKVFLLGAQKKVNKDAVALLISKYPNVIVKGSSGAHFDSNMHYRTNRDSLIDSKSIQMINDFQPDLLFVAFGAPKQEIWLLRNLGTLKIGGAMVVGGSLDSFTGNIPNPPGWVSAIGIEWLWRLLNQPSRFFRTINALIVFPLVVLKERLVNYTGK